MGRVLGQLVTAGITDVHFVAPPLPEGREPETPEGEPVEVLVGDGGRTITLRDTKAGVGGGLGAEAHNINAFVSWAAQAATRDEVRRRPFVVKAAPEATDTMPVDLSAPAAALHVLGFAQVRIEGLDGPGEVEISARLAELRARWEAQVLPQEAALREAAQVHYETMQAYQEEINRLLDEAEQLRRQMEQLQDRYDALTTPRPATDPG